MSYTEQILGTIDARIAEATEEMATLESALEALMKESSEAAPILVEDPAPAARKQRVGTRTARGSRAARGTGATRSTRATRATSASRGASAKRPAPAKTPASTAIAELAPTSEAATAAAPVTTAKAARSTEPRTSVAPAPTATRSSRARKPRKLDAEGLTAILERANEGLSAAAIAERANASYNQVLELLREREQAGDIRRSGTRRSTLWHLITDEERIAERAAQLAAL